MGRQHAGCARDQEDRTSTCDTNCQKRGPSFERMRGGMLETASFEQWLRSCSSASVDRGFHSFVWDETSHNTTAPAITALPLL